MKKLIVLQNRIRDRNAASRATVVAAIRYTFAESTPAFDELLGPLIIDFLSLMRDPDLVRFAMRSASIVHQLSQTVRRLALSALNSVARTKAHLVRDHLHELLPGLYEETIVKPELIRTVQMGPWTHKVDDGLEARKTAYETLYTLVRCFYVFTSFKLTPKKVGYMPSQNRPSRVPGARCRRVSR
jgi:cullin-associated NEDD8-dissociated protein 1